MATYTDILVYSLLGSVFSMIGGVLLLSHKSLAKKLAKYVTPFAAGAMLAAVFLDLIPEALEKGDSKKVMISALAGLVVFFYMERYLRWFHHHHEHKDERQQASKSLIVIGDTIHNAVDGIVIASAFLLNAPTGIIATIAVAAHEIPQEIGDFGLLLSLKMSRVKVLIVNLISALATVVAALITFKLGHTYELPIAAMLGASAGFLLYIAASDIIPTIHEDSQNKAFLDIRPYLLLVGIFVVSLALWLSRWLEH
jgi:zinc and cadmium transporter